MFMGVGNKPHSADTLEPHVSVSQAALGAGGARGAGGRHADGRCVGHLQNPLFSAERWLQLLTGLSWSFPQRSLFTARCRWGKWTCCGVITKIKRWTPHSQDCPARVGAARPLGASCVLPATSSTRSWPLAAWHPSPHPHRLRAGKLPGEVSTPPALAPCTSFCPEGGLQRRRRAGKDAAHGMPSWLETVRRKPKGTFSSRPILRGSETMLGLARADHHTPAVGRQPAYLRLLWGAHRSGDTAPSPAPRTGAQKWRDCLSMSCH